ncbi:MAG: hypothetical protein K0R60_761 [Microbacterium sp.]|nr:hypothetical protein [Microbacterium sp.]
MNDTTYAAYLLDQRRAADLARENELIVAQRERGAWPARPQRRPLAAWLRTATHRTPGAGAAATRRGTTSVATR